MIVVYCGYVVVICDFRNGHRNHCWYWSGQVLILDHSDQCHCWKVLNSYTKLQTSSRHTCSIGHIPSTSMLIHKHANACMGPAVQVCIIKTCGQTHTQPSQSHIDSHMCSHTAIPTHTCMHRHTCTPIFMHAFLLLHEAHLWLWWWLWLWSWVVDDCCGIIIKNKKQNPSISFEQIKAPL